MSLPLRSSPNDAGAAGVTLARLRAECEAAEADGQRAQLLYEIGMLEQLAQDEGQAARDLLAAVNASPDFVEPLERLIGLIERRRSFKNLGRLLERLTRVAEEPEETSRAQTAYAAFLADHGDDLEGARTALEKAVEAKPDDLAAWLALEVLAGKTGDAAARLRALKARARSTTDPTWKALLLLDQANLERAAGEVDAAVSALDEAFQLSSGATYLVARASADLGEAAQRPDLTARALEAQAQLILAALEDASVGDSTGVPGICRTATHAVSALLRAADAHRQRGDMARAAWLLDHARETAPDEPVLLQARLGIAEMSGDATVAAALAQVELATAPPGPLSASLWMRVAEAAAVAGDALGARDAVARALEQDPACLVARALQLDLFAATGDAVGLSRALEQTGADLPTPEGRARFSLLAADVAARGAGDTAAARAALDRAAEHGTPGRLTARIGRLLAAFANDGAWYEAATEQLMAAGVTSEEKAGLCFDIGRRRLLRGDVKAAEQAFLELAAQPESAAAGWLILAYATAQRDGGGALSLSPSPLRRLADLELGPGSARALRLAAAVRAQLSGDLERGALDLEALLAADSGDLLVATYLAALRRRAGRLDKAASALSTCGREHDSTLGVALELEAAILMWLAGDRKEASSSSRRAPKRRRPQQAVCSAGRSVPRSRTTSALDGVCWKRRVQVRMRPRSRSSGLRSRRAAAVTKTRRLLRSTRWPSKRARTKRSATIYPSRP